MTTGVACPVVIPQYFLNNGQLAAGGSILTQIGGLNAATYQDIGNTTPLPNPIPLNSRGEISNAAGASCQLFLTPNVVYTFTLSDAQSNQIWVATYVNGIQITALIVAALLDALINVPILASLNLTAAEMAAGIVPTNYTYAPGNVLRYGADPTGVLSSTAAFNTATLANFSPITAPNAYKSAYVPGGQYKIDNTVYVPAGTILHGDGMSSYIDASTGFVGGTTDVFKLGWSLVAGVPTKDTIYLTGGFPPEIYGLFFNGGPPSAYCVEINYPGALAHDMWFSAAGTAVYLAGGNLYDCEIDAGLTGITIGPGINQVITNVRFFNQNTAINFDTGTADIDTCIITGCTIEYPKIIGVSFGNGTVNIKGIKIVGCTFNNNPGSTVTSFANCINVSNSNTTLTVIGCTFNNWGKYLGGSPTGAIAVAGANAIVDLIGNLFDGAPSNALYTASTTAAALVLTSGTVRMSNNHFRNLPFGGGIGFMSGSLQCSLKIDGLIYDNVASSTAFNISNNNANSIFVAENVQGDGVTTFLNPQANVATQLKNMQRWFGGIGTSGGSNFVNIPYQQSGVWQLTLTANQNAGGSANYRKTRMDWVEKDNEFATSAKSFLVQNTTIQGAANTNGLLTLTAEFATVGGGTTIASSNAGLLAISWPTTYTQVSIEVQQITSG